MKKPIRFLRAAENETDDAIAWYEEQEPGLGSAFRSEVEKTLSQIQNRPDAYPVVWGSNVRRSLVNRFPYVVFYADEPHQIFIFSIFHTSRNPIIWRGRID